MRSSPTAAPPGPRHPGLRRWPRRARLSSVPGLDSPTPLISIRAGADDLRRACANQVLRGGRPRRGRSGTPRLVLEVLLRLVGRYGEQGVTLHVCCKALQGRPFRMASFKVGARRALGAVGGAWRDSATMCYSGPGAGRSGGVLPGPVALRALEVASYRRSRGQGSGSTTHL